MTPTPFYAPSISSVIESFFADYSPSDEPIVRRRVTLVKQDLLDHMDKEGWRVLTPTQSALFQDKQFNSKGTFARLAPAPALFCILEHYLNPVHALVGIDQRQVQLDVVEALADQLWTDEHISQQTVKKRCRVEFAKAMKDARELLTTAQRREKVLTGVL
jgi:hypothetical protein